ncbi:PREDICTED: protein Iojap-related, mitochondrial [Tarenaya hassleriana]|uniref:protein Iojap-related, mitochondrial n=1 Tax=Tarenaya hassleriana TaxID=28532 RepID=UPI00053C18AA|nr:PREDICTED: protein Iojap-related, mitochondrial [Tarenaya hassleriana]
MLAALRSRSSSSLSSIFLSPPSRLDLPWKLGFSGLTRISASSFSSQVGSRDVTEVLTLPEVEKILSDVKADNVTVIPMQNRCNWADFMVVATGRSTWHVKNIAQALIHKVKQKQKGAKQLVLPSVEGQEGGKWIVIDSGKVVVHALDEKARDYFDLENIWTAEESKEEHPVQELGKAFVKVRPKNNSKKPCLKV